MSFGKKLLEAVKDNVSIKINIKPIVHDFLVKESLEPVLKKAIQAAKDKIPGSVDDVVIDMIVATAEPVLKKELEEKLSELQIKIDDLLKLGKNE
jgi:hypothetical protein